MEDLNWLDLKLFLTSSVRRKSAYCAQNGHLCKKTTKKTSSNYKIKPLEA